MKKGWHILGLLACIYFAGTEIYFDMNDTPEHPLNIVTYWFLPLSIFIFVLMICFWRLADGITLRCLWLFFVSMAGNWVCRFYFMEPNVLNWHEYFWMSVFAVSVPVQIWYHNYKNRT